MVLQEKKVVTSKARIHSSDNVSSTQRSSEPTRSKEGSGETTSQFEDKSPRSIAQRKLQELANNSLQVKHCCERQSLINSSPGLVVQCKQLEGMFGMRLQSRVSANGEFLQDEVGSPRLRNKLGLSQNESGLPDPLKAGIEGLSGLAMDHVRVHYNSSKPAQWHARAYTRGTEIHIGPGQERHLPHEAWHVVQQRQGRVKPTLQLKGVAINNDKGLESEADVMGYRANKAPKGGAIEQGGLDASRLINVNSSCDGILQARLWNWDGANWYPFFWSPPQGDSFDPMTEFGKGAYLGEQRDDRRYSQERDKTVRRFLKRGQRYMGEDAAREQTKGKSGGEVRVIAQKTPFGYEGAGLHEIVPTNMDRELAKYKMPHLTGLQSGARTSTQYQGFKRKARASEPNAGKPEVGLHTGYGKSPHRNWTRGQAEGHDRVRKKVRTVAPNADPYVAINEVMLEHLNVTMGGDDLLTSNYITGLEPNDIRIGRIEPLGGPTPNRKTMAQMAEEQREGQKRRVRTLKRHKNRGRSPSPQRILPEVEPLPLFKKGTEEWEAYANEAAWLTVPGRVEGSDDEWEV
jgi:hypothetical protein